jgi:hypothetical protein
MKQHSPAESGRPDPLNIPVQRGGLPVDRPALDKGEG